MRKASAQIRATMSRRRNFVNYATMTLADGTVLNLEPKDFRVGGNEFTDDVVDGENFQVGSVLGKTVTIRLDNSDDRFSEYDFYMAYFYLYVHLPDAYTDDDGNLQDGIFRIGKFTVIEPATTGAVIDISGADEMCKFDLSFDDCTLDFNQNPTLLQIAQRCCNDCGVAIGFTSFDNSTLRISEKPLGVTYREVISYIAQIAGVNAKISDTGALQFIWYDMSVLEEGLDGGTFSNPGSTAYEDGDNADGGSFNPWDVGYVYDGGSFTTVDEFHNLYNIKGLTVSTDDIKFTGVRIKLEETDITVGTSDYMLELVDNPFTAGNERAIATFLLNKLSTLVFRTFSCSHLQDPTIEAGDPALVWDRKGNVYKTVITNVTFSTSGYMSISCNAQSPTRKVSSYKNPVARAAAESREHSDRQLNAYASAVDHFNEIATNAMGYYRTDITESGATTTYLHDQHTLAASKTIVKITGTGVFISEDGGKSYTSGYDTSTATMLMNMLYVQGITAGYIQDKKGNFFLDLDNGTLNGTFNQLRIGTKSAATEDYATKTAQDKADKAQENAEKYTDKSLEGLDQDEIFERLTNGLAEQGLYMIDGTLYINSTYIQTGILKVGGIGNNAKIQLLNSADNVFGTMDNAGIRLTSGVFASESIGQKKIEIQSLLKGYLYYNGAYKEASLIDLAANYNDGGYRHAAFKGYDYLHLQAGTNIYIETGASNSRIGYFNSSGWNGAVYGTTNGSHYGAQYGAYYSSNGTYDRKVTISSSSIYGYYNNSQYGLLDLAPYYGDSYKHTSLNGNQRLHLQASGSGGIIYMEAAGTQAGYFDNSGYHGSYAYISYLYSVVSANITTLYGSTLYGNLYTNQNSEKLYLTGTAIYGYYSNSQKGYLNLAQNSYGDATLYASRYLYLNAGTRVYFYNTTNYVSSNGYYGRFNGDFYGRIYDGTYIGNGDNYHKIHIEKGVYFELDTMQNGYHEGFSGTVKTRAYENNGSSLKTMYMHFYNGFFLGIDTDSGSTYNHWY